jgi:Tol biopolymer transport system component
MLESTCFRLVVIALCAGCRASDGAPAAPVPELYGAGLFSTGARDLFIAFSPDQTRALLSRGDQKLETFETFETRLDGHGHWSAPVKPRFAIGWSTADPHIAPDGKTVFFLSTRPNPGETAVRATHDIWYAALGSDGEWGEAQHLPAAIDDPDRDEWCPSVAANGNLYFSTERPGGHGGTDLYVARRVAGGYAAPENLGDAINTPAHEFEAWIAPDERYLVFSALHRAGGVGGYDLFVSHRRDGRWQPAQPLAINTAASEYNESVSPDGKWLYFSSTRRWTGPLGERFDFPRNAAAIAGIGNGNDDVYRIPAAALGL